MFNNLLIINMMWSKHKEHNKPWMYVGMPKSTGLFLLHLQVMKNIDNKHIVNLSDMSIKLFKFALFPSSWSLEDSRGRDSRIW